jgi:Raf kinase inhibitor-like YbhB/YbcL family protein
MKLVSSAFDHQQSIPDKYTCRGANVNPPLQFLEVPEQAKSLVLLLDDPDAPAGIHSASSSAWVHWVVFNMDSLTLGIEENRKPTNGIEGMTSFGNTHYGGPCPPSGTHRYFFKLYALDTLLELTESADKEAVEKAMQGHILDKAELIGLCSK